MKIAIMQPTYLPWIGYFDLIDQVNIFVFLDNVQFARRSWQQRNRIKTDKGAVFLTVPVIKKGLLEQKINEVKISDAEFYRRHIKTLEFYYSKAHYFSMYAKEIFEIIKQNNLKLADLNKSLIKFICSKIGIKKHFLDASTLGSVGKKSSLLANICTECNATEYLSPLGSASYIIPEIGEFERRNIEVLFHRYNHPKYNQLYPPFISHLSIVDLIFNEGPNSLGIIRSGREKSFTINEIMNILNEKRSLKFEYELNYHSTLTDEHF